MEHMLILPSPVKKDYNKIRYPVTPPIQSLMNFGTGLAIIASPEEAPDHRQSVERVEENLARVIKRARVISSPMKNGAE